MKFNSAIRAVFAFLVLSIVAACGGGDPGNNTDGVSGTGMQGTVAIGKPLTNTPIQIKDKNGKLKTVTTDEKGKYFFDFSKEKMEAPFLIKVTLNEKSLFSLALNDSKESKFVANVHPFSDVVARNWFASRDKDIDALFESGKIDENKPNTAEFQATVNEFKKLLQAAYTQYQIDDKFDFLTTAFDADQTKFDAILDSAIITIKNKKINIKMHEPNNGIVVVLVVALDLNTNITRPDTQAPTIPTSLQAISSSTTSNIVVWNASVDNIGVAGYNVFRDGVKIATTPFSVFSDLGLTASTKYCYKIEAFDASGNKSAQTSEVCATTLSAADSTAPSVPQNISANPTGPETIVLSWSPAPENDVFGYDVFRGTKGAVNDKIATTIASGFTDTGRIAATEYCYKVRSFDAALNRSELSGEICATTSNNAPSDSSAPTSSASPTGGTFNTSQTVSLQCNDGTGSGCAAIYFTRDGSTPTDASSVYTAALAINESTTLRFYAVDRAGNTETPIHSENYVINTVVADTQAPQNTTTTNFIANGAAVVNSTTLSLAISATDNIAVTAYCAKDQNLNAAPALSDTCWKSITATANFSSNVSFNPTGNYASGNSIQINVWFRDATGNISQNVTDTVTYQESPVNDVTAPNNTTVNNFVNNGANTTTSLALTLAISATDNVAVTAYCAKDASNGATPATNDTCWKTITATADYNAAITYNATGSYNSGDSIQVYVWFRDAAGNISSSILDSITYQPSTPLTPQVNLSVTLNPDRVRPGEALLAQFRVTNSGGATANDIVLQATYPATGVSYINQSYLTGGATCSGAICNPNDSVIWNVGNLAPGASVYYSMPMTVASVAAGTTISLPAEVRSGATTVATTSKTVTVDTDNALALAIDQSNDTVKPGEQLVYSLTYGNRVTTSVTGTELNLPLPSGVTFVSATNGGVYSNNNVHWTLGALQAGQTARQQVTVLVNNALADGTIINVDAAEFTGTHATTGAELARATISTRVHQAPDLGLSIEMNPDPVRSGDTAMTKLTVTNNTNDAIVGTKIEARFPGGYRAATLNVAYLSNGGICSALNNTNCYPSDIVTWNIGSLGAHTSTTVSLPIVIGSTTYAPAGSMISMSAAATADGKQMVVASHTAAIESNNALSLAINEDRDSVAPGEELVYTLTYGNQSAESVTSSTLSMPIPIGTTFVSATNGGIESGNIVQWNLGTLLANQSGQQKVVVKVNNALALGSLLVVDATEITGTHTVTGADSSRATATTRVAAVAPLALSIEMNPDPVRNSDTVNSKFTVTNRSNTSLSGTKLEVRFPGDYRINALTTNYISGGATCRVLTVTTCYPNDFVTWNIGSLASGESITFSMPMVVGSVTYAPAGSLISLDGTVVADGTPATSTSHTVVVDNNNALSIAVDESNDSVAPGETLVYTVTYGNHSTANVTSANLRFPIPRGVTFVSATGGGTATNGVVEWNLGTLLTSQSGRQQITVTVNNDLASGDLILVDSAQIGATHATTGPELARATATTRVRSSSPLRLVIEMDPDPVRNNNTLLAKLTVANQTDATIQGATLEARFPGSNKINALNIGFISGGASCVVINPTTCYTNDRVIWNLGTLAARQTVTVTLPLVVGSASYAPSGSLISFDAFVVADSTPMTLASHTAVVDNDNALSLSLDQDQNSVAPNGDLIYTLTYGNRAAASITENTLSIPLPSGVSFGSATGGGSLVGNSVQWNIGTLTAGQVGRRQVTVKVNSGIANGTLLVVDAATITGKSASTDVENARATSVTRVIVNNPLHVSVVLTPNPIASAGNLTGTISVTSDSDLTGVVLLVRMPSDNRVNAVQTATLTDGASCPLTSATYCYTNELITWNIGAVTPSTPVTRMLPMKVGVASYAPNGSLIVLDAEVKSDGGNLSRASDTAAVSNGTF